MRTKKEREVIKLDILEKFNLRNGWTLKPFIMTPVQPRKEEG